MKGTILGRDPAVILEAVKVLLVMLATFGLPLSADQQVWILVALSAGFGLWKALLTRPVVVTAVTDFIQAIGVLALGFNAPITQAQLAAVVTFASAVMLLQQRQQITPTADPRPLFPGDPAAPAQRAA